MKRMKNLLLILCVLFSLCACNAQGEMPQSGEKQLETQMEKAEEGKPSFASMPWEEGVKTLYAKQFSVEQSGEYYLITIADSGRFLLIPEGKEVPSDVPEEIVILQKPLNRVYLASSSVFDLIRQAGAMECLRFSGTKKEDLSIAQAVEAMDGGTLLYAGKYSKPDYELLICEGCDLAIENTMIYHNPETKEKLENLGIPVLVETSSYEGHPFGRMEWIKLYGVLFDRLSEAEAFFQGQVEELEPILQQEGTGVKVAFFYVNSNGVINVRKPGDYVAKMIALAGGEYILKENGGEEENALSTMNMQMEDFYMAAKDADIIVYNSTIVGELESVRALQELHPLFADFKAVKEGRVYCTAKNFFQETTSIGTFVDDLSRAIRDPEERDFRQLIKLD